MNRAKFGGLGRVGVEVAVHGAAEVVGGEQVQPVVADDGRAGGDGVERPLQAGPGRPLLRAAAGAQDGVAAVGLVGEAQQVGAFGVVELQGAGDRVEDAGGDPGEGAAFELGVVLHAHAGQRGDLAAPQPGDAALPGGG